MSEKRINPKQSFQCFLCGVCCTRYQVRIELSEAKNIAKHLNLSLPEFLNTYTDSRWPGENTFLISHRNGKCIFLESTQATKITKCSIHSFRPQDCRNWTSEINKPECQKGLAMWNLEVNSAGKLTGSSENLCQFSLFMKSLNEG
jgi:Fe-S-cluster containining protein